MGYRNILWIDDCDVNDAGDINSDPLEDELNGKEEDNTEIIKAFFGNAFADVNLVKEFTSAIEEIKENHSQYDLVVFDMNMQQGIERDSFDKIKELLQENRVIVREKVKTEEKEWDEKEWEEFLANAGIYLYLYLLNMGYPNSRMIILTGNGVDSPTKRLEDACIGVDSSNLVEKSGGKMKDDSEWITKYYKGKKNTYYLVRRMVYKACEYWKEYLLKLDDNISFNKIYYKNNPEIAIAKEVFINMLERLELLFPVVKPFDDELVYYQALQVLTMFHEESAKMKELDKYPEIKKYHQTARNFRNWSAHNKIRSTKMDAEIFIYIFCITLRTYFEEVNFEEKKQLYSTVEWYRLYEKEALESITSQDIDFSKYEKYYRTDWQRHFKKVMGSGSAKSRCWECSDINRLLLESGNCDNKNSDKMEALDCILNLLENHLIRKDKFREEGTGYLYSIEYEWKCEYEINKENVKNLMEDSSSFYYGLAIILYLKMHNPSIS